MRGEAYSILSAALWAYGVILYQRLGLRIAPLALNLQKNLVVLALIVPACWLSGADWSGIDQNAVLIALLSGAIGIGLADTLYFLALNRLDAGRMGVIGNLYSPFMIVLSFLFLGERLSGMQVLGFGLVSTGVLIVSHGPSAALKAGATWHGFALAAASILLMAVSVVIAKRVLEAQPLLPVATLRLVGGVTGLLLSHAWLSRGDWGTALLPPAGARWLLLRAALFGQFLAMLAWLAGYKYTSASIAAVLNESASVFIVLLAWLMLKEPLGPRRILGVACTLSGVALMLL